jgi:hypothetical protein
MLPCELAGNAGRGGGVVTSDYRLDPSVAALFGIRSQSLTIGDAQPYNEGGPDDPYWQTDRGRELYAELTADSARRTQEKEEASAALAERNRIEREAEQKVWAERRRNEQAKAAADRARAEEVAAEERERLDASLESHTREVAARRAGEERKEAASLSARQALHTLDEDFCALALDVNFAITGGAGRVDSSLCPEEWSVLVDVNDESRDYELDEANLTAMEALATDVKHALAPSLRHLARMGLLRADRVFSAIGYPNSMGAGPAATFYLIVRSRDYDERLLTLADWPADANKLSSQPALKLFVSASIFPLSATCLYEALKAEAPATMEWGREIAPDRGPGTAEDREDWLARVSLSSDAVLDLVERWEAVGRDLEMLDLYGPAADRSGAVGEAAFLIERVLPRGCVSSLVGNNQAGKSSLAHEFCSAIGRRNSPELGGATVLGLPIAGGGMVALLSGEDTGWVIGDRAERHARLWGPSWIAIREGSAQDFGDMLHQLERTPRLDLVVVDPARAFLEGDEDSSGAVSRFYDRLTRLARTKNCAVLVVHHLTKGRPRTLPQMLTMVRGSGVHTDRPRVVIGMLSRGDGTVEVGLLKYNFPQEIMWGAINQGFQFRRDPESFTLVPLVSGPQESLAGLPTLQVIAAVNRIASEGEIARRSGKRGLFELRTPELAGLSRSAVLEAIAALIGSGELTDEAGSLQTTIPDDAGTRG